ncbi:12207_t:CDS:2, partial [Gigaspora margarita]
RSFLDSPRTLKTLQNLRRERFNSLIQSNEKVKPIRNNKEAFDWLQNLMPDSVRSISKGVKDDDKNEPEPKKPKRHRIMKERREDFDERAIPNLRPRILMYGFESIDPLTIFTLLDKYKRVVESDKKEIKKIETLINDNLKK